METVPFEIAHCSSFEQDYEPEQLLISGPSANQDPFQNVNHRGWQTQKLPEYPQDLILHFKPGFCRIYKVQILSHHYKIASQIELYIGITKELDDDSLYVEFTRLGFVTFDNNNRFQDRELKSIKIQADCEYIRLVVKGCHQNRLNVHKQVGILAVNIIGHEVRDHLENNTSAGIYNSPNIMNDEGFTQQERSAVLQYPDFNLEQWIQVIRNTEEESAQDEDFKQAKLYKELGDRLTGLLRFLINLENEKLQAVATKDYDEAEKIKADMIQVRETAESLLKQSGIQITPEGDILPLDSINSSSLYNSSEDEEEEHMSESIIPDIQSIKDIKTTTSKFHQSTAHSDHLLDEAIANWTSFDALSINNHSKMEEHGAGAASPSLLSARIPINNTPQVTESIPAKDQQKQQIDPETIPEPLTSDDIESCELAIQQFGEDIVACIMSIKVKCRQNGLNQLSELILEESISTANQEKGNLTDLEFAEASLLMIQEAVTDSRESIFNQAIGVWKELQGVLPSADKKILGWVEKLFSRVLMRTGDNNPGIKTTATKAVLDLIEKHQTLTAICLKERMIRNLKDAKARFELVTLVTKKFLIPRWKEVNTFYRGDMMNFIVSYLKKHPHADVQKSAYNLLFLVAQHQDFKAISTFLENDTIMSLQKELKKSERKRAIKSSNSTTVNELRALAVKSNNSVKNTTVTRKKQQQPQAKSSKNTTSSAASTVKKSKKVVEVVEEEEEEDKNNVCIFCEEEDDNFNEDTLISHYYNDCPVLTNCPMCQIILEVSTLKEHTRKDCEKKHLAKQCNNCKEAIPVEQWLQHTLKNTCTATAKGQSRCPFCQTEMTKLSESDWKHHLVTQCAKNPRKPKH